MLRLYRGLLCLYPAGYRREFGCEMARVFSDARSDLSICSFLAKSRFYVREGSGLIKGAVCAHMTSIFGFDNRTPLRRFNMRPGFRFPRSTVFLMCVILAGVVLAIDKAKTVVQMKEGLVPAGTAVWVPMLGSVLLALALVLAAVAAVWGILFALRRSGMHRLSNVEVRPDPQAHA